ncbi:predicted protein [Sclerotinia sclerotiorum 1980 UF-70]|uniref:Uncharacterized protein n=1 Tax=Sclerotinia sclerotiorum (strain ATCC 18683 / 1980 / Ss-1) TaxID=665079 RepID=A7EF57_SCLS1|nr:predicted protein [Sclerotinia sclerotiorum 1980 UF-70]EDO01473.1 predicted protein [Sclerotinia sclerotiorum 1980 UF-70]
MGLTSKAEASDTEVNQRRRLASGEHICDNRIYPPHPRVRVFTPSVSTMI